MRKGTGSHRNPRAARSMKFELREGSDPASVADQVDDIEAEAIRIAEAGGLAGDRAQFLGVALREAILNALLHGRSPDGRCEVEVRFRKLFGRVLSMMVRDRGPGFDPDAVPDPRLPENASRSGGRGIFFMRQFADRVRFVFPEDGGVIVQLGKRLPGRGRARGRRPAD